MVDRKMTLRLLREKMLCSAPASITHVCIYTRVRSHLHNIDGRSLDMNIYRSFIRSESFAAIALLSPCIDNTLNNQNMLVLSQYITFIKTQVRVNVQRAR